MRWFEAKEKFDPARQITEETFMKRVIRNKLLNIQEEKLAKKRLTAQRSITLSDFLEEDENKVEKVLSVESNVHRAVEDSDLLSAMEQAFQKMSSRQKELCRLLGEEGLSVTEASKHMNVPRTTLNEEIKRIREVFRKEGLENYLR